MTVTTGTRIGVYEVLGEIGAGGMGVVYRARDTKLDRDVALKVLPEAFTADPERLARFEREAKVLASLNHPNIGHIYGLEEAEGTKALVLELVEGPTLADRIAEGPIPLEEALPIAKQVAEALEAAHEQGIIHRDLKPANAKVKADGTVKVLDFGLAKALDPQGDPSQSPTLTAAATQMSVVMGTAAYMAPEQAKGKPVDKRADVWAFGVVLYEMLTGRRPFLGDDASDTLAHVLTKEVDWSALPPGIPPSVRRLLRRCLTRDPRRRLADVADARLELDEQDAPEPDVRPLAPAGSLRVWPRPLSAVGALVVVASLSSLAMWTALRPGSATVARFTLPHEGGGQLPIPSGSTMALSPDGRQLVYAGVRDGAPQLFLRSLDQVESVPLRGTEGGLNVFWSPDGESIGFVADGALKKVAGAGGTPVTLLEGVSPYGASWGDDDTIVFGSILSESGLRQVSADGGVSEQLTARRTQDGERGHVMPQALPRGDAVLFTVYRGTAETPRIAVHVRGSGQYRVLFDGAGARYLPTGHLVFVRDGTLWMASFDPDALEVTGAATPVLENVYVMPASAAQFSFS